MLDQPPSTLLESVELPEESRRGFPWGTVIAWLVVILVEVVPLPNKWVGAWMVPAMEAAVWVLAVVLTVLALRFHWAARAVAAPLLAVVLVWFNNWALYHPQSYFVSHRLGFDAVAALVESRAIGTAVVEGGEALPRHLADLSTTGTALRVGGSGGKPIMLLPQRIAITDEPSGYVYVVGPVGPRTMVDLLGVSVCVCDGLPLGDGWYYVTPDE